MSASISRKSGRVPREATVVLTRNHRQEALSRAYIHAIAAQAGLSYSIPMPDYGIDISLRTIVIRGNRRTDGGIQLDIQAKSTTRASVGDTEVAYDLEVDSYNDLRETEVRCPRILVVLVLPAEETQWLSQSPSGLTMRHCAYWMSLKGRAPTDAVRKVRVFLPLTNVFSVSAVQAIMQRIRERSDP
jgi:hypothetical protein